MSRAFHAVALVIGGVALAFLLYRLGWAGIERVVVGTGWWFALIAAIDLASVACDAGGVHCFARMHVQVSYWRVFAAQASGLAINRLTPGNSLGEPVKITMLMQHVPEAPAVSSIVMFNLSTIYLSIAAIVVGVPLTVLLADLSPRAELVVWVATGVLVAFAIALGLLVRRGALGTLIAGLARIRFVSAARAARWTARIADIDANIRQLGRPGARRAFLFVLGSRVLNWCGTVTILVAADIPLDPPLVIAMLSVGMIITWVSNVIPLGLGLADGGNYALYGVLGSSGAVGLDFTMINRLRTCVLAMMGLSVMAIANTLGKQR